VPDEPAAPEQEETDEGYVVFWEPACYSPDDIEAELPDGTRLKAVLLLDGRRLGFERPLPRGTQLLRRGEAFWWRPVGERE
jgi:hypothetical protein